MLIELMDLADEETEETKEMLTKLAIPFIDELNNLKEDDEFECCDIRELSKEAFTEAFADQLDSREMAKCLKSFLVYSGGYFYEIARWHFFLEEVKNKRMGHWG